MSAVPAYAERLSYLDQIKVREAPSRFVAGLTVHRPMFACPACHTVREPLPPNEQIACACGIHMHAGIAYLHIWRPAGIVDRVAS